MNDRLIVIGITGLARSGKDTIANILVTRHGFTRIALADGVRSAFSDLDGPTWELRKELENANVSMRRALQILGTECRESTGYPRLWIGLVLTKIAYLALHHPKRRNRFVIPDVRYPAEVSELSHDVTIRFSGAFRTWKVYRDGAGLGGSLSRHSSESQIELISPDFLIYNNKSITNLETTVAELVHLMENQ